MKGLKALWEKWKQQKQGQWLLLILLLGLAGSLLLSDWEGTNRPSAAEQRIAQVLSAMEGAGKVEIAIYYSSENSSTWGEGEKNALPVGAVVVAEGANRIDVRLSLIRAVRTLLGLDERAVEVFPMGAQPLK